MGAAALDTPFLGARKVMGALKDELLRPATIVIISICLVIFGGGLLLGAQGYSWLRKDWRNDIDNHANQDMHEDAKAEFARINVEVDRQGRELKEQMKDQNREIMDKLEFVTQGLIAKGILPPKNQ